MQHVNLTIVAAFQKQWEWLRCDRHRKLHHCNPDPSGRWRVREYLAHGPMSLSHLTRWYSTCDSSSTSSPQASPSASRSPNLEEASTSPTPPVASSPASRASALRTTSSSSPRFPRLAGTSSRPSLCRWAHSPCSLARRWPPRLWLGFLRSSLA